VRTSLWFRNLSAASLSAGLCACTGLNVIHDPQSNIVDRRQVQGIVKSAKCELITYLEANRQRKKFYFDVSEQLFGNVLLDLNVVDVAGFGAGSTNLDRLHTVSDTENFIWHLGPTLNGQGTYDMILSFLLPQNARLNFSPSSEDTIRCYSGSASDDFEGLANGKYPESEQFTRIRVNAVQPLAAWLLQVGSELWPGMEAARLGETAYPVQMAYTFTVQVTAGLDVKYTLTNPVWNPLGIGAGASTQQTNKLTITINGADASLAIGASGGTAVIGGGSLTYEPPTPPRAPRARRAGAQLVAPGAPGGVASPQAAPTGEPSRRGRGQPHGYLLSPLPLTVPKPVR
jgi:hypothetical protein